MILQYFSGDQIFPLIISAVFLISAIITFHIEYKRTALFLLFVGTLCLGFFIANLDHFLVLWDEQYHALVAKNMLDNPFKPTLYSTPLFGYDYRNWSGNHIWLHKQPLFLWQIAISLKLFGINEVSVRVPSIVLHAVATFMIYRIGKISCSENVGFYGALFFAVAYYPLELVAGKLNTDHNDLSFLFYVTASFWAWFEYLDSKKLAYLILIGLFSGCAVLVKWLVGLLVFSVWFLTIVISNRANWFKLKSYYPLLLSFFTSLIIFIPWQLYILWKFPLEANYEFLYNTKHFFEPLENHSGNIWFHFNALKDIYGSGVAVPFLYLLGLILFIKNSSANMYRIAIISAIVITYGFYSIAATKMTSFCIIVSPFAFLGLGALIDSAMNFLKNKIRHIHFEKIFRIILLLVICTFLINVKKIANYHTNWKPLDNCNRIADLDNMKFISKLTDTLQGNKCVVFNSNVRVFGSIPVMFYTKFIAYDFVPDKEQIEKVKNLQYKIAIWDNDSLPNYITNDKDIIKVKL